MSSSLFRIDAQRDTYGVMGHPVEHSKSPLIHTAFAAQTGESLFYQKIPVPPGGFPDAVDAFRRAGGRGLNVTLPFKHEACMLAGDALTARAALAGAVNTLWFDADGGIHGDNTDGVGLVRDLRDNHGLDLAGRDVLVLGAGGAVAGILGPLLDQRPASLTIANRTVARARALARRFEPPGPLPACGYDALPSRAWDVIINATAASVRGEVPPLSADALGPDTFCYDLMYADGATPFLRWCVAHGAARAVDGLGMLVEQAAESFFIWRGIRPSAAPVIEQLRGSA